MERLEAKLWLSHIKQAQAGNELSIAALRAEVERRARLGLPSLEAELSESL